MHERVLIKGAGDLASGTAHRLFRCGYRVVMTELEQPTAVRRAVAFSSAVERGRCEGEGVEGVRHELRDADQLESFDWSHVPVFVDPPCAIRQRFAPHLLRIDFGQLEIDLVGQQIDGQHAVVRLGHAHDGRVVADPQTQERMRGKPVTKVCDQLGFHRWQVTGDV